MMMFMMMMMMMMKYNGRFLFCSVLFCLPSFPSAFVVLLSFFLFLLLSLRVSGLVWSLILFVSFSFCVVLMEMKMKTGEREKGGEREVVWLGT